MAANNSKTKRPRKSKKAKAKIQKSVKKTNKLSLVKAWIGKFWKLISLFLALSGVFAYFEFFHKISSSKEKLWIEDNYVVGGSIPLKLVNSYPDFIINTGGLSEKYHISTLRNRGSLINNKWSFKMPGCLPENLELLVKNDHLFISTIFKDIDDRYVGKIDFDRWEAKNDKISKFNVGSDYIELLDSYGFVIFNMKYKYPNIIDIQGYFNADKCIVVVSDSSLITFEKNLVGDNKRRILNEISKIKRLSVP